MTLIREVAEKVLEIYNQHSEAADMDAAFDGGEFSGPAHDRMAEKAVRTLCEMNNVNIDDVQSEIQKLANEELEKYDGHRVNAHSSGVDNGKI